jgi:SAM-dependent methyltransferase
MRHSTRWIALALALIYPAATPAQDAPFLESPEAVVEAMLELAEIDKDDIVYDLGSGDGRIVIAVAIEHGARAIGVESRSDLVELSERRALDAGVDDRVEFVAEDFFETDFSDATVVMIYLSRKANRKLESVLLEQLTAGTRVISHRYSIEGWRPDRRVKVEGRSVFLYVMPPRYDSTFPAEKLRGGTPDGQ